MGIDPLSLPVAGRVNFSDGDVDYLQKSDPVYAGEPGDSPFPYMGPDNRPLRNLSYRDYLISQKLNEVISALGPAGEYVTQSELDIYRPYIPEDGSGTPTPDDTLHIRPGQHIKTTGERAVVVASAFNTAAFSVVASGFERYDLVVLDDDGNPDIIVGTPVAAGTGAALTDGPSIPDNRLAIAYVKIDETATVLVEDTDITDIREFLNKGGGGSSKKYVTQPGHGFSVGMPIRHNGTIYVSAQADTAEHAEAVGIVSLIDGDSFSFVHSGYIDGLSGLTSGDLYFLDASSAGALTVIEPADPNVSKPMLLATSAEAGIVLSYRGVVGATPTGWSAIAVSGDSVGGIFAEISDFRPDDVSPAAPVTLWQMESAIRFDHVADSVVWFSLEKAEGEGDFDLYLDFRFSLSATATVGDACRMILAYWIVGDGRTPNTLSPDGLITTDIDVGAILGNTMQMANMSAAIPSIPTDPVRIVGKLYRDVDGAVQNYANDFDLISLKPRIA